LPALLGFARNGDRRDRQRDHRFRDPDFQPRLRTDLARSREVGRDECGSADDHRADAGNRRERAGGFHRLADETQFAERIMLVRRDSPLRLGFERGASAATGLVAEVHTYVDSMEG